MKHLKNSNNRLWTNPAEHRFRFMDQASSYGALRKLCVSLSPGEKLIVEIVNRNVQSPEGLEHQINDELGKSGIKAKYKAARYGFKPNAEVLIVRTASS